MLTANNYKNQSMFHEVIHKKMCPSLF